MRALITMLPSNAAVREAYLGSDGILRLPSSDLHAPLMIDSSTIDPLLSREVAAAAAEATLAEASGSGRGVPEMLDAPVSGGVPAAAAGTLTFMVGGEAATLERARPYLERMGKRIVHCGGAGAGQAAKLCNNLALGVSMAGVAEALALGQRLGLDLRTLTDVFNGATARCWSSDTYNPVPGVMEGVPASRDYRNGFGTALMHKDLTLASEAAGACGAEIPMSTVARDLYAQLAERADPAVDFSGVYKYIYGGEPQEA